MKRKKRSSGIYRRGRRWWGDFRAYRDVGGRLEPLVAEGQRLATTDGKVATILYADRIKHYESLRRGRVITGIAEHAALAEYAEYHLDMLRQAAFAEPTARPRLTTIKRYAASLANVIDVIGPDTLLTEITAERLSHYIAARRRQPGRRTSGITAGTIRSELVALSSLMKRAVSEHKATVNPVLLCVDRPTEPQREAVWLELEEAAALLQAAHELDSDNQTAPARFLPLPFLHPILATFLLTGGRRTEVLGLEVQDVDFSKSVVRFRHNRWRRLKSGGERAVPLWPQLRDVLDSYLVTAPRHISGLLFPSPLDSKPIRDFRTSLVKAVERAKIKKRTTLHTLRHTYTAARLRTFHSSPDGQPVQVSAYYVARELGHSSVAMIERVYGHVLERGEFMSEVRYELEHTEAEEACK